MPNKEWLDFIVWRYCQHYARLCVECYQNSMLRRFEGMRLQRHGTGMQGCQDQFLFRNVGWILHDLHSISVWLHSYCFDESAQRDAKLCDGFGFLDCGSQIIKENGVGSL